MLPFVSAQRIQIKFKAWIGQIAAGVQIKFKAWVGQIAAGVQINRFQICLDGFWDLPTPPDLR